MPTLAPAPTKLPLRAAFEARDHAAVVNAFAPDAVFRSPITGGMAFDGHEQIGALAKVLLEVIDDIRYTDELRSGETAVLVAQARIDGADIEIVDHMRLDDHDKIRELTVFFRPMPAIAIAARAIGTGLGRRRSPTRAAVISLLARPLVLLTRIGDPIAVRLLRGTL
jgi:hypothetical protein